MTVTKPERLTEIDQAAAAANAVAEEVEGEIRAFVRRDISLFRRPKPDGSEAVDGINSIIDRVAGASVGEI